MKFNIKIVVLLLAFSIGSCSDFVDEIGPTSDVSVNDVFASEEGVRSLFVGMYRRFRFFNDGVGDDSEAIGSILNTWNVKGNDILRPQFHWFVFEYRYQDNETATGRKTNLIWNEMYELINSTNDLIERVEVSSFTDAAKLAFTAEAHAIRGMAYHHLIREYAQAYVIDPNGPGVPIYTESANIENGNTGNPRATVGEVYAQIRSDLEFASANLTIDRVEKWAINKNVADGLLARTYMFMGLYAEAAAAANDARNGWSLNASSYNDGFNSLSSPEWMWGADFSADQTLFFGGFSSFWDGSRYPAFFINENLVNQYSATDVRNTGTFTKVDDEPYYLTTKIRPNDDFSEDLVLMRVAEMYLIEAEALARSGNDADAAALLFELQSDRDPMAVASGNIGTALIDEILLEDRKERVGEGGPDYIQARRLGLTLTRDTNHTIPIDLVRGDSRFIYPIPQAELDSNPMINDEDQNPS
jgi:hypothetical protein